MAPPRRPRGGGTDQQHDPLRGPRGGGINKRRQTVPDRDGDVEMSSAPRISATPSSSRAPTAPARGGNRGGRRPNADRTKANLQGALARELAQSSRDIFKAANKDPNKVTIRIRGLKDSKAATNSDGGLRSLLEFLERKASKNRQITLGKAVVRGADVCLTVSQEDAQSILRLDGYTFAGVNLSIQQEGDGKSHGTDASTSAQGSNTSDVKSKMLGMLASRYNFDKLLLDLSALGADPTMIDLKAFETKALAEKTFKALLRLVSMRFDTKDAKEAAIQAVSLANNGIIDVKEVFDLARDLPRLRRLDLSNNNLQDFSGLSKWRHEFRRLEELYLVGNPVTNLPNYPKQIIEWFPSLQILDGQPVRTPEEAANALKEWFPQPIPVLPSNLRDGGNNVASAFLSTFFPAYDSDRPGLLRQFYDDESVFSLVAEPEKDSAPYQTFSRNLEKFGSRDSAIHQRLFTGVNLISELWSRLPPTHHPNLTEEPLWKIDCHTFQNLADPLGMGSAAGLIINVRSRFEELDPATQTTITRQFHRCFILGPSKPGAPHPFRVVSDQLVVTPLQPLAAAPQVAPVAPTPVVQPVPALLQDPVLADDVRANLIMEVSRRTGMTAEYSELCLSGMANWDLEMALRLFEEKRGELPPEAFLQPA